ncbi:hypothetical protein SSX86_019223 [Deinandra increscens subsp. villosa]|uniref:Uncharacterized protein n=1 Tax=Deinandra increscens subsp. villosa TaxID=3103831 RepID=A0AAP0GVG0_9ASTR
MTIDDVTIYADMDPPQPSPPQQPPPQQPPPPPQQPPPQQPPPQPQPAQQPPPQQSQPPPPPQQQQQQQPQPQQQQRDPPSLQQPNMTLVKGTSRDEYLKIGVPLYEASIKCNWKAAKAILDKRPELVGFSITEHGDTPLHVAASAKGDLKRVKEFVKNLVDMMTQTQLRLINKNHNTALYLAAVAGNVETVAIMVKEDRGLLKIPGANKKMMPLYGAALFGNADVVKYIYEESKILTDEEGWSRESRGWLIEKLVENNMFDTALKIVIKYPVSDLTTKNVLRVLAGKPEAFQETKSKIMGLGSTIMSVLAFICFKRAPEKKSNALPLLKFIWDDIVKKPTKEIDTILRGIPDTESRKQDDKTVSRWAVKVMRLHKGHSSACGENES